MRVRLWSYRVFKSKSGPESLLKLLVPSLSSLLADSPGTRIPPVKFDTLAQIKCELSTSKLAEIGRSDVKLSQVDPKVDNNLRQHRIQYGRYSGLAH